MPPDTSKRPEPAKPTEKSETGVRDEGRAKPVRALCFPRPVRFPGISGASTEIVAGKSDGLHRNALFVDSILEYKDDFIVDGAWFVPRSAILARKY